MNPAATPHASARSVVPSAEGSHRDRLLAAMAEAIREQDFEHTTVADVVARARTSRRTFYQHFEDREACYLALYELLNEQMLLVVAEAASGEAPWHERLAQGLAAYLGLLADEPELTRSALRELPNVGDGGWRRHLDNLELAAHTISRLVDEAAAHDPTVRAITVDEAAFLAGGFSQLVVRQIEQGGDPRALHPVLLDLIERLVRTP